MRKEAFCATNICVSKYRGADLKQLSLSLYEGEVLGLFGNRYAGKGALFRVIMGLDKPDSGVVRWNGKMGELPPRVVRVDKNSAMIDDMLVWENIAMLWEGAKFFGFLNSVRIKNIIRLYFEENDIPIRLNQKTGTLSQMEKLLVEILIALRHKTKIFLIDLAGIEATAQEYVRLRELLQRVKQKGVSVLVFCHQIETVTFLSDNVAIIYEGRIIKQMESGELDSKALAKLKTILYGEEQKLTKKEIAEHDRVLEIRNLDAGLGQKVSLDLHRGEFVAIVSPQLEMFQILQRRILEGEQAKTCAVTFRGTPVKRLANGAGIYFLNTRYLDVLIEEMSPLENLCLGISDKAGRLGLQDRNVISCMEQDFYEWYGHDGLLQLKDCRQLYRKDRIAINLFRLRFLKLDAVFCNTLSVHNDLVTYRMVKEALASIAQGGAAVCMVSNDFVYHDELVERYVVLDDDGKE